MVLARSIRFCLVVTLGVISAQCAESPGPSPAPAADPQRVIALAPSVVELLYELDLGDRVIGVGDYTRYPLDATTKPKLGGLFDPHLEEIARLSPDLAILLPSEDRLRTHLETLGIEVLTLSNESLDDIETSALTLGGRFGVEDRAEKFTEIWRKTFEPAPLDSSPRVLLAVSRQQGNLAEVLSAGPGTFYAEMLDRMGAENVFSDAPSLYPQVSLEELMQRHPDAIFDLRSDVVEDDLAEALRQDWNALKGVPAVDNGCHHVLGGDYVLLPGPRATRLYREIREALEACGF